MTTDADVRQEKINARWCQLGHHDWRATVGGPFGHTQPDAEGYIQVCPRCGVRRPMTPTEAHMSEAVRDLLRQLNEATRQPSGSEI